jgi:hypothetical protein
MPFLERASSLPCLRRALTTPPQPEGCSGSWLAPGSKQRWKTQAPPRVGFPYMGSLASDEQLIAAAAGTGLKLLEKIQKVAATSLKIRTRSELNAVNQLLPNSKDAVRAWINDRVIVDRSVANEGQREALTDAVWNLVQTVLSLAEEFNRIVQAGQRVDGGALFNALATTLLAIVGQVSIANAPRPLALFPLSAPQPTGPTGPGSDRVFFVSKARLGRVVTAPPIPRPSEKGDLRGPAGP